MKNLFNLVLLITALSLSGCIATEETDADGSTTISYSGKTTAAPIESPNDVNEFFNAADSNDFAAGFADDLDLTSASTKSIAKYRAKATQTTDETVDGDCGGSMRVHGSGEDTAPYYMDLTITANDYCDSYSTINGSLNFTGDENNFTLTFTAFEFTDTYENVDAAMHGNIVFTWESNITTMVTNIVAEERNLNQQVKFEDYTVEIDEGGFDYETSISGRVYQSDDGYVYITTIAPIVEGITYPKSGKLKIVGDGQTAYVVFGVSSYEIFIDENANATWDAGEQTQTYSYQ